MMTTDGLRPANPGRKALGKLASRLEEVKNPWRQVATLELSHNEAARLATDALLDSGEKEYRRVLAEERELNFLSPLEIHYITEHAAKTFSTDSSSNGSDRDFGENDAVSELTSGTYFPMMSDEEPPLLELGWPDLPNRFGPSETQIYFQRDKSHNVKDIIRSLINKAKKVVALVMDVFTDVDLFCDLMEASNKRKVPVYILLDEKNLKYFIDMCNTLDITNTHLGNMRIRSVCGETYCTKSGKKLTGQVQERFMIIDCEEVVAGSYSFTWLSAQVHNNMVLHFSGQITDSFDREFRCLYADSQIIQRFHNADEDGLPYYPFLSAPATGFLGKDFHAERSRERVPSDNSSSQSSSSASSVKAAPGATPTVYKVSQERREPVVSSRRDSLSSASQAQGARGLLNGTAHGPSQERRPSAGSGQSSGIEWSKGGGPEYRSSAGGAAAKFQGLGLYEHKPAFGYNGPQKTSPPPVETKPGPKPRSPSHNHTIINKFTDLFTAQPKDTFASRRPPPYSTPFGGPDLSQAEPESSQLPPPPPSHGLNRHEQKRMTLGHSKLDLVNHYNKIKSKNVYSRFELKENH